MDWITVCDKPFQGCGIGIVSAHGRGPTYGMLLPAPHGAFFQIDGDGKWIDEGGSWYQIHGLAPCIE
jgi:hypothetical protein